MLTKKKYIYNFYKEALRDSDNFVIQECPSIAINNHWMTSLKLNEVNKKFNIENLINHFAKNEIQVRPMWYLCHLQNPYIKKENFLIENAIDLQKKVLNIPCSTNITDTELDKVCSVILNF